jgi:hypothetical protein
MNKNERKKNLCSSASKFDASCTLTILTKSGKKNGVACSCRRSKVAIKELKL